ncbi:MAG: stage II sporulation protein R [Ruminococcus sp.]|nr:stage II sporulation protein R [Ruminococcus sp.]
MKKLELACLLGMAGAMTISVFTKDAQTRQTLENDVLRLHILANSDSAEDQLLKYAVRDAVLEEGAVYFEELSSCADAKAAAAGALPQLEEIARETVSEWGYDYEVTAELSQTAFGERVYEEVTLPAGVYDAVRICIGQAEGQNWWCVMYPPLCVPAAAEDDQEQEVYFTEDELEMMTEPEKFRYRLKCVEWLKELWETLCE